MCCDMRFQHAVVLAQTKVITLKTQPHAVNAHWKLVLQHSLNMLLSISSSFYIRIFWTNIDLATFSSYILALAKNLYKKTHAKYVNEVDTWWNPKSAKWHWWLDCLFMLLWFSHLKVLCKHIGKIDPCSCIIITFYDISKNNYLSD